MSRIECPICGMACSVTVTSHDSLLEIVFLGSIVCYDTQRRPPHSYPCKFIAGIGRGGDIGILPAPHSVDALGARVQLNKTRTMTVKEVLFEAERGDLIQDIEEANTAKLWELYKASVVMCRRVIQISLLDCLLVSDGTEVAMKAVSKNWMLDDLNRLTLGPLLDIERRLSQPLLDAYQRELARKIKEAGDDGAHNKVELEPDFIDTCIREAAVIAATLVYRIMEKRLATNPASQ